MLPYSYPPMCKFVIFSFILKGDWGDCVSEMLLLEEDFRSYNGLMYLKKEIICFYSVPSCYLEGFNPV